MRRRQERVPGRSGQRRTDDLGRQHAFCERVSRLCQGHGSLSCLTRFYGCARTNPNNSAFSSWDMMSSIGPITGVGEIFQWNNVECPSCGTLPAVVTNDGTLVLVNASPDVIQPK